VKQRPALPTGTPTFLFTDIEGSTKLLHRLGDRYAAVRSRHLRLLVEAFEAHGGVVFGTEGDALFVAFETATGAVAGAIAGQQALAAEPWDDDADVRVRMGMHTGEVQVVDGDYVGMSVHIAARVASAGHGGQVLATDVTTGLAGDPPARDLGRHHLKDVGEHRILQLLAPGLGQDFPPIRTASSMPNNLPAAVDEFVGRGDELEELLHALDGNRLVTVTGPGGSGKTRLAIEAAHAGLGRFPGGVWLVDLAPVDDDDRVVSTVAQAMGVREADGPLDDAVEDWLRDRRALLLVDNCEQVVDGVARFCTRFLAACPELRVLATSRAYLGVRGEHCTQIPPLGLPDEHDDAAGILASDAVELFLTRAVSAAPGFDVGGADIASIASICRRLDGLPLAIELAAARLRALSLDQLAARLDDRFRLLRAGSRTDVARHQTLTAVVQWSYDLLGIDEQRLFERLGAFPHHFSLEMAEAVAAGDPIDEVDVIDLLTQLLDKSLVSAVPATDGVRYQLLETLRAFAVGRLAERGEEAAVRERLLAWSMRTVEELEAVMRTPAMDDTLRRAALDAVTHRAAAQWAAANARPLESLRIASVVPLSVHRSERATDIRQRVASAEAGGVLDPASAGHAWAAIGSLLLEAEDPVAGIEAHGRAAEAFTAAGNPLLAAWSTYLQAHAHWGTGDLDEMDRLLGDAVDRFRSAGDDMGLGYALWVAAQREADLQRADALATEADEMLRRVAVPGGIAHNVEGRGIIALEDGRVDDAARYVAEAVRIFADYDNPGCTAHALEAAAVVLSPDGLPDPVAVELLAAAERFRQRSGQTHRPWEIRNRGGRTAQRVAELDEAVPASSGGEPVLSEVADRACRALLGEGREATVSPAGGPSR
jgi:predicted ATPase/class 3 adenylate cyclase